MLIPIAQELLRYSTISTGVIRCKRKGSPSIVTLQRPGNCLTSCLTSRNEISLLNFKEFILISYFESDNANSVEKQIREGSNSTKTGANWDIINTSAIRLLQLRGCQTICVRRRLASVARGHH